jgi:hypothetical protein
MANDNVVRVAGGAHRARLIPMLQEMLRLAEAGEIRGMAVAIIIGDKEEVWKGWSEAEPDAYNKFAMIGAIDQLKYDYRRKEIQDILEVEPPSYDTGA